ncbi:MAG TPA: HAD-IC family P-type ATPase [Dehalococcoidia bacterium]|nr:HAD-IC family P-type ATPase [Dehalococcoidia bacterium]
MTGQALEAAALPSGLTSAEAEARRLAGQSNAITWTTSRSFSRIVFENAATPINVILFGISAALLGLQLFGDAFLTGGLVLGNVIVGVFQETRAKRQLDRIALLNRPLANVIRDGKEREIPPEDAVLGDSVVLRPGDQVIADGKLISVSGLGMDESLLTGESDTLQKRVGDEVVSGTYALTGSGIYEAIRVGADTTANEITVRARQSRMPRTPLQREVGFVLWAMTVVVIILGFVVARAFRDDGDISFQETVRAAAVIVALVPQGLAVMVTVSYAMAAVRLSGTGVLIQHLNAVESISHVDVLCLDKTGTLTTNRLTVECLKPYRLTEEELQIALGTFAASASFRNRTADAIQESFPQPAKRFVHEVAFDSTRKWSGLAFDDGGLTGAYVFGAPDVIAPHLSHDATVGSDAEVWTEKGLRVLLLARSKDVVRFPGTEVAPLLPPGLTPLGLVVLRDETRTDAASVISEFAQTGIALKVISGDHPDTVAALAEQAGIPVNGLVVYGPDIEAMEPEELIGVARRATVFGRVSPRSKELIVDALRRSGRYVAMVGDGVNDVPALKAANVAVALRSGSGITRDIADMVLLNDAFSNLPRAFREGQRIRKGMESIFRVFLTRTVSLTLMILAISLLNDPFPVTPKHTALIAMLTVGIPTLFLAVWAKPGRVGRLVILSGAHFVVPAALAIAAVSVIVYEFFLHSTGDIATAQSALTFTAILCGLLIILFLEPPSPAWVAANPLNGDWRSPALVGGLFALFVAFAAIPVTREFYEIEPFSVWEFAMIGLVIVAWGFGLRSIWRFDPLAQIHGLLHGHGKGPEPEET